MDAFYILSYAANSDATGMPRPEWIYSETGDISSLVGSSRGTNTIPFMHSVGHSDNLSAIALFNGNV